MKTQEKKLYLISKTLEIILNPGGDIRIKGRAMEGDLNEYLISIDNWIDSYLCNPVDFTSIDFYLEYCHRSNSIIFIHWLKKIAKVRQSAKQFCVNWYYDEGDEDILEKGEHISSVLNIPFNFIKVHDPFLAEHEFVKPGQSLLTSRELNRRLSLAN